MSITYVIIASQLTSQFPAFRPSQGKLYNIMSKHSAWWYFVLKANALYFFEFCFYAHKDEITLVLGRIKSPEITIVYIDRSVLNLLGQFGMPETCENWLGVANSCVYYAPQSHKIYQVLSYPVDFKLPESFEIHGVKQYLVNVVLFRIKTCKQLQWP